MAGEADSGNGTGRGEWIRAAQDARPIFVRAGVISDGRRYGLDLVLASGRRVFGQHEVAVIDICTNLVAVGIFAIEHIEAERI